MTGTGTITAMRLQSSRLGPDSEMKGSLDKEEAMTYREEDVMGLKLIGKNVFELEKEAIMNLKTKMAEGEGNTNKNLMH